MSARKRAFLLIASLTRFGVIGAVATAAHLAVAVSLVQGAAFDPIVANLCAFAVAFVLSFFGHHMWTFAESRVPRRVAMARFFTIALGAFALNNAVLVWLLRSGLIGPVAALIVAILIIPVASYVGARLWAFRP